MKFYLVLVLFITFGNTVAFSAPTAELRTAQENGWELVGRPDPGHLVRLTFALKQHNPDWLQDKLRAVSYPDSPQYTNYMNFDEIAKHVYGEPESVKAVTRALESMGAQKIDFTIGKDFIIALVPFESIEAYFYTSMYVFKNGAIKLISALQYTVPNDLQDHVDFISGIELASVQRPLQELTISSSQVPGTTITPEYLNKEYNINSYISTNPNNSQAVASFLKQYFTPSDLEAFQKRYKVPLRPISKIVGKNDPKNPGIEASLDVEYISATGRNVSTWFVSTSTYSNDKQEDFLSWMATQVNTTDSPWVHSVSYGDDESSISRAYLDRFDNEFAKFGISGRSVLFASGDSGVNCNGADIFSPSWPSSSPFVTAVGGTTSLDSVWPSGGGGFSNHFTTPAYQYEIVEEYLKNKDLPSKMNFNISGRAYPDVSAFAVNFEFIEYGVRAPVSGTSCATPTVAGIISLLNDIRLNKGQKTLGFLNPLLYGTLKGNGFVDVIYGNNGNTICKGFEAIKGWDAASGWGSPNFSKLKNLI